MNTTFNHLVRFVKKNKYLFAGIVLFIVAILLLRKPLTEGFTTSIGEYDYLAPVPPGNMISDASLEQLQQKIEAEFCKGQTTGCSVKPNKNFYNQNVREEEIQYYINNGKWPWGSYLLNAWTDVINKERERIIATGGNPNNAGTIENVQKNLPSRMAYGFLNMWYERRGLQPDPIANDIYKGIKLPPDEIKNKQNYQKFVDLCKTVVV